MPHCPPNTQEKLLFQDLGTNCWLSLKYPSFRMLILYSSPGIVSNDSFLLRFAFRRSIFVHLRNFWICINKFKNTGFYIFCFLITIFMANNWLSLQSNTLSQSRDSHMESCLLLEKQKFSKKLSLKIRFTSCLSSSVLSSKLSQSPTWKKTSSMFSI